MHADLKRLLAALDSEKAEYLVIGGHAVALHTAPRDTDDLDLLIGPGEENAAAVLRALEKFGARLGNVAAADLATPGGFFRMGQAPVRIDLFIGIDCLDFALAWRRRVRETIDPATEQTALFIAAPDLIALKQASGRPGDLADVALMRRGREKAKGRKPERRRSARKAPAKPAE